MPFGDSTSAMREVSERRRQLLTAKRNAEIEAEERKERRQARRSRRQGDTVEGPVVTDPITGSIPIASPADGSRLNRWGNPMGTHRAKVAARNTVVAPVTGPMTAPPISNIAPAPVNPYHKPRGYFPGKYSKI